MMADAAGNMDRDIPSVLTTLAGVTSLTGLLNEMPLPTPLPQVVSNKSLLFHPRVAEEAHKLLGVRDNKLVPQLVHSLVQTSADNIELKHEYSSGEELSSPENEESRPELLRAILEKNPAVFQGMRVNSPRPNSHWNNNSGPSGPGGGISTTTSTTTSTTMYPVGRASPCGSRHTPQGSPASPSAARVPAHAPGPSHSHMPAPSHVPSHSHDSSRTSSVYTSHISTNPTAFNTDTNPRQNYPAAAMNRVASTAEPTVISSQSEESLQCSQSRSRNYFPEYSQNTPDDTMHLSPSFLSPSVLPVTSQDILAMQEAARSPDMKYTMFDKIDSTQESNIAQTCQQSIQCEQDYHTPHPVNKKPFNANSMKKSPVVSSGDSSIPCSQYVYSNRQYYPEFPQSTPEDSMHLSPTFLSPVLAVTSQDILAMQEAQGPTSLKFKYSTCGKMDSTQESPLNTPHSSQDLSQEPVPPKQPRMGIQINNITSWIDSNVITSNVMGSTASSQEMNSGSQNMNVASQNISAGSQNMNQMSQTGQNLGDLNPPMQNSMVCMGGSTQVNIPSTIESCSYPSTYENQSNTAVPTTLSQQDSISSSQNSQLGCTFSQLTKYNLPLSQHLLVPKVRNTTETPEEVQQRLILHNLQQQALQQQQEQQQHQQHHQQQQQPQQPQQQHQQLQQQPVQVPAQIEQPRRWPEYRQTQQVPQQPVPNEPASPDTSHNCKDQINCPEQTSPTSSDKPCAYRDRFAKWKRMKEQANRSPSPVQSSDVPAPTESVPDSGTIPDVMEGPDAEARAPLVGTIITNQPVVRLARLSVEDQQLMQKSLSKFAENRPKLASKLGIKPTPRNSKSSDSEDDKEDMKSRRSRTRRNSTSSKDLFESEDNVNRTGRTRHNSSSNKCLKEDEEETASTRSRRNSSSKKSDDEEYVPDTFTAFVGGGRKRKPAKDEKVNEIIPITKPKLRRVERKFVPVLEKLSTEELMETNTFHRFNRSIESVLEYMNEALIVEKERIEQGFDDIKDDVLLFRSQLQDLCTEAAKLKVLGAMEMIPTDKLVRLLNVLEINIRGANRMSLIADPDENETIRQMIMEASVERVMGAADAALTCLYIMTSTNMPKRVYLEDVIDRVIMFVKYQLHNTIFPSFDSVYRIDFGKKKDTRKKKINSHSTEKCVQILYNKIHELVSLMSELLNIQIMTDTTVLHASSMGVAPFFAENISELQLSSLKLVTMIFTKYEMHRRLVLDDILASIARLPSNKRSLRNYRLNGEEQIQMLTALVLQLIQCVVALPDSLVNEPKDQTQAEIMSTQMDKEIIISTTYEKATHTAATFLAVFLNKCGSKTEEIDYRPLFENFVQDLLTTVNKPEWPAAEVLLSILGTMLVKNFSDKSTDTGLRVASLDYLGVVAARLRRDTVMSRCKMDMIDQMIKDIKSEEMKDNDGNSTTEVFDEKDEEERTKFLQRILLDYLAVNGHKDEAHKYARHFYIAQWYKDATSEKARIVSEEKHGKKHSPKTNHRKSKRDDSDGEGDDLSDVDSTCEAIRTTNDHQSNAERFQVIEMRKKFYVSKIRPFQETISSGNRIQVLQTYIDYSSAELVSQYLASKRSFSQSFDRYLKTILLILKESSIQIRTKAMKCLTMIVEADPSVLGISDMQIGVNHSFLDSSTSVREAAVDLIGKFVLSRPELIDKYYDMLSTRILDTGVSVRKRVIKILKDICIECPEFPKIPEICVKMIRRVNDEEGIRKLVMEVFQNMWFTPTPERPSLDKAALLRKVMNITDVVTSANEIGLEWFEYLLVSLFKPKEDKDDSTKMQVEPPKALLLACKQIVDCLIENVLRLEETGSNPETGGYSERLVSCLTTLHLFAKIRPQLLVKHASTLQPYLTLKCHHVDDLRIISKVAGTLELVVPLMEHPSETFLAQLEEDAIKLILQHDRLVVLSCLACLGSIVNNVTRNYKLIRDCFSKYYGIVMYYKELMENSPRSPLLVQYRPRFRRALYTVGLLLRHFDFTDREVIGELHPDIKNEVFYMMMFLLRQNDEDIQTNTLKAIGFICIRHYEFMLEPELKDFYHRMLVDTDAPLKMKNDVLGNIEMYLTEEDSRMIKLDQEWAKRSKEENLKEMGDVSSGMASTVIQLYLKEILQAFLHPDIMVRHAALKVIQLILQQGLVHPVQIIPYLICMCTDSEKRVANNADKQLADIEKKYPGFIHTKSQLGIRLSYQLQTLLQGNQAIVRGSRVKEKGEYPSALNGYLYALLRGSRQQRRALVLNMLKQFDEQVRTSLSYMLYLADNLAYFPYAVQDEPLFIVHHIDIMISVSGTNLLQSFREGLIINEEERMANSHQGEQQSVAVSALDEDDEDFDALVARLPNNTTELQSCITAAQGCLLLLVLKQHLKDFYGLSDNKISQYSPSDLAKVNEKATTRRPHTDVFNPKATLNRLKQAPPEILDMAGRKDLISQYLNFKQLMLKLDPDDPEDEDVPSITRAVMGPTCMAAPVIPGAQPQQISTSTSTGNMLNPDQVLHLNYKEQPQMQKVPKLVISNRRTESSDNRRPSKSHKSPDKSKKHRHKKKRKKVVHSSGDDSENSFSDPDFMA